jgi:hypothetical protein
VPDVPRPYPVGRDGVLTPEGLGEACRHVWRDSNSIVMLGADILNSEPVSYDDKNALLALKRHVARAGPRSFVEDVLPKLGFGPPQQGAGTTVCTRCGQDAVPLHLGCTLCEDCCDCRPGDATC